MNITVMRLPAQKDFCDGLMLVDDQFFGYTEEDPPRPTKIPGVTAIPKGRYPVTVEKSEHFTKKLGFDVWLPRIHDVPEFEGVLIHGGNTAIDTEGCILVASRRVMPGTIQGSLSNALTLKLKHAVGPHWINIYESKRVGE